MKKNNFDFTLPQRQSYVAILMIIWKTYRILLRQVFPFLLIFFLGKSQSDNYGTYLLYFVSAVALIGMAYSIVAFFRYYYYIEDDKLIVEKGVFGRSKTSIPFERIQTINFEENLAHKVFSVLRLKVDTAGSSQKEFEFDAIKKEEAHALRGLILDKKDQLQPSMTEEEDTVTSSLEKENYTSILQLSITDLLKVGITENHLRSGGLILFAMWWIYDSIDQAGLDVEDYTEGVDPLAYGLVVIVGLGVVFVVLSFLISLVRTVLTYYNLQFYRSRNGFKLSAGLFTTKDTSALDHKIQMISYSDNILQKIIGYFELQLKQASSIAINSKSSIKIPGCKQNQIDSVTHSLYGRGAFDHITLESVDIRFMYRRMFFLGLIGVAIGLIGYFVDNFLLPLGIFLTVYFIITSYFRYRKCKFGHNDHMLIVRGGLWGDKVEIVPIYKAQNIVISQSPYQRRNSLANVKLSTAAGSVTIPYVDYNRALQLSDYILYVTESSKKKWM